MTSFADMKRNRGNQFDALREAVKPKSNFVNHDAACWKPTLDKAGSGFAIVRFLPAPVFLSEDEMDFAKVLSFNVKRFIDGKAQYYIENSLKTLGRKDPADVLKWEFWNKGDEESKNLSRAIKERTQYYSNIYVIKDLNAPQNEGKVFPYRYGQQIFGKIENALTPEFPSDPQFNPFDIWEGRNFIVKVKTDPQKKLPDYSASEWEPQSSPLATSDDRMEQIWKEAESIKRWIGEDRFKDEKYLKDRIYKIMELELPEADEPKAEPKRQEPAPAAKAEVKEERAFKAAEPTPAPAEKGSLESDDDFLKQFGGDFGDD